MTDTQVHEALVRWLSQQTDIAVIKAHQSGERPREPYLMVWLETCREVRDHPQSIEYMETSELNSEGEQEVTAHPIIEMEWDFSIYSFGENPMQALRRVVSLIPLAQRQEPLFPDLVIHDTGPITYEPEKVQTDWEPRAKINLQIRGLVRDGAVIDVIEHASVSASRA